MSLEKLTLAEVIAKYEAYGHPDDERTETSSDAREIWYLALVSLKHAQNMIRTLDYAVRYHYKYPSYPEEITAEKQHQLRVKILAMGRMLHDLGIEPEELKPPVSTQ